MKRRRKKKKNDVLRQYYVEVKKWLCWRQKICYSAENANQPEKRPRRGWKQLFVAKRSVSESAKLRSSAAAATGWKRPAKKALELKKCEEKKLQLKAAISADSISAQRRKPEKCRLFRNPEAEAYEILLICVWKCHLWRKKKMNILGYRREKRGNILSEKILLNTMKQYWSGQPNLAGGYMKRVQRRLFSIEPLKYHIHYAAIRE